MSQACVVLMVATVCFTHTQFFVILFLIHDNLTMKRKKKKTFFDNNNVGRKLKPIRKGHLHKKGQQKERK